MNRRSFVLSLFSALFIVGTKISLAAQKLIISVKDFGAVGNGSHDDSLSILKAHQTKNEIYYPDGTYLFKEKVNPDFTEGVSFGDNVQVNGKFFKTIYSFDKNSKKPLFVGLQHNHLESSLSDLTNNEAITTGVILKPPISTKSYKLPCDLIAHWYNDFGLESTRFGNGLNGNLTWYYWDWAHTKNKNYDPSRHPLLGWYRGDDINVLDWQCYWLREYGVTAINIVGSIDVKNWSTPSHKDYWKYTLFHSVKNFKGLKYILWISTTGTIDSIYSHWLSTLDLYLQYPNYYFYRYDNKNCPVVNIFEGEQFLKLFNAQKDHKALESFLLKISEEIIKMGFPGLIIFFRNMQLSKYDIDLVKLKNHGIYLIPAGYSNINGAKGQSYKDLVESFIPPRQEEIVNIATAKFSVSPHPSKWKWKGSSPALFQDLLEKAVESIINSDTLPKILQIYNVSEWAEGGPGLQPNQLNGFGYLQAVKNVAKKFSRSS